MLPFDIKVTAGYVLPFDIKATAGYVLPFDIKATAGCVLPFTKRLMQKSLDSGGNILNTESQVSFTPSCIIHITFS